MYYCDGIVVLLQVVINVGFKVKVDVMFKLVGFDKKILQMFDENGKFVVIDWMVQCFEVWVLVIDLLLDLYVCNNDVMCKKIMQLVFGYGYFSIWVVVFIGDIDMCNCFIDVFLGMCQSGCFNVVDCLVIICVLNLD